MVQESMVGDAPAWGDLGAQFCLELAFGVLLALAFVPQAPVGKFFYRLMGSAALVPLLVAALLPVMAGGLSWSEPAVLVTWLAVLAWPLYSGPARGARFGVGLALALVASGAALALTLQRSLDLTPFPGLAVGTLSALATGTVAGSVGLAMVLGHWYLTVPKLEVRHLARLNRVTVFAMLASLALLALSVVVFRSELEAARTPLFGPWGLMYLGVRVAFGVAMPLLFAWMTASSLKVPNTRSATGILYASTVLVLIGTAVAISLQSSYGVPL